MAAILRFLAGVFLLVAVIYAANDATHALAGRANRAITVHQTWSAVSPTTLKGAQAAVERYTHGLVWTWGVLKFLQLPAWLFFGAVGLVLAYAGRRRRQVNVYAN